MQGTQKLSWITNKQIQNFQKREKGLLLFQYLIDDDLSHRQQYIWRGLYAQAWHNEHRTRPHWRSTRQDLRSNTIGDGHMCRITRSTANSTKQTEPIVALPRVNLGSSRKIKEKERTILYELFLFFLFNLIIGSVTCLSQRLRLHCSWSIISAVSISQMNKCGRP